MKRGSRELLGCRRRLARYSEVVGEGQTEKQRRMDKMERMMKMVKRKKRGDGASEGCGAIRQPNSPDTVCDELCGFHLCIGGEHPVFKCVDRCLFLCVGLISRVCRNTHVCLSVKGCACPRRLPCREVFLADQKLRIVKLSRKS